MCCSQGHGARSCDGIRTLGLSTAPPISHRTSELEPVLSLFGRLVALRASLTSDKSAELTAASLGNASATSGLRTTTFETSRRRFAYFPLTRGSQKSERLYSARRSFLSVGLVFFIHSLLSLARQASAHDTNRIALLSMREAPVRAGFVTRGSTNYSTRD